MLHYFILIVENQLYASAVIFLEIQPQSLPRPDRMT